MKGVHPSPEALALLAGGDLPRWRHWTARWHLKGCARCRSEVAGFRGVSAYIHSSFRPAATDVATLEREMLGNIGVGLAAARCVDNVGAHRRINAWRVAAVLSLAFLFVAGWITHIPRAQTERLAATLLGALARAQTPNEKILLKRTRDGINTQFGGQSVTVVAAPGSSAWLAGPRDISMSSIDDESGTVTVVTLHAP